MPALLFGSISTLADTSELQRSSFNQAFADHGLGWEWPREEYRSLLGSNGGAARIADYARARGEQVDADAVHATKSVIFQKSLVSNGAEARPGVIETMTGARSAGYRLGFVTTTSAANVEALFQALAPALRSADFDIVTSAADVPASKPDPAVYELALRELGLSAADCVAIEDNPGGAQAAVAAGIVCAAFPNENTGALDFGAADPAGNRLSFEELAGRIPRR